MGQLTFHPQVQVGKLSAQFKTASYILSTAGEGVWKAKFWEGEATAEPKKSKASRVESVTETVWADRAPVHRKAEFARQQHRKGGCESTWRR